MSWLKPHPERYKLGNQLNSGKVKNFERFGIQSFVPVNQIISRCAHGMMDHNGDSLLVVIPLV